MILPLLAKCRQCKFYDGFVCTEKTGHDSPSYVGMFVKPNQSACVLFEESAHDGTRKEQNND